LSEAIIPYVVICALIHSMTHIGKGI